MEGHRLYEKNGNKNCEGSSMLCNSGSGNVSCTRGKHIIKLEELSDKRRPIYAEIIRNRNTYNRMTHIRERLIPTRANINQEQTWIRNHPFSPSHIDGNCTYCYPYNPYAPYAFFYQDKDVKRVVINLILPN